MLWNKLYFVLHFSGLLESSEHMTSSFIFDMKKYQFAGTVPKSNSKMVEISKIDIPNKQIHDHSFSWLGIPTSIKSEFGSFTFNFNLFKIWCKKILLIF
jgi:hypothetical protein